MKLFEFRSFVLLSVLLVAAISCRQDTEHQEQLGFVELEVTGSEEAKSNFERGLLLLHSFEYSDAAEAFREAQQIDAEFSMAYWGEAMTYNHPLWRQQAYEKANEVLNRLAATPAERKAKAVTDLEKDFLSSVDILYGEGTKFERDKKYAEFMGQLYKKYPENQEVAAFYALSLLGSVEVGRDDEIYEKGAVVAQAILLKNPSHPGALHYLIHSYDDPYNAFKALDAANSYSVVAKDASHALHMPSHIYVALGMWDEVVNSNTDSWQASIDRMNRLNLDNDAQSYHALHWLLYGYLQQGHFRDAENIMTNMIQYTDEKPSVRARDYLVAMKGTFLVETNDWESSFVQIDPEVGDLNVSTKGALWFTKGVNAYLEQDQESLEAIISQMTEERKEAETRIVNAGAAEGGLSGQGNRVPNRLDVDQLHIMELELLAIMSMLEQNSEKTELYLKQAVELQESISYSYGPPVIAKPSYEIYAEWLLDEGRFTEAKDMFDKALKRGPGRIVSLSGKLKALENLGNDDEKKKVEEEINKILHSSDRGLQDRLASGLSFI